MSWFSATSLESTLSSLANKVQSTVHINPELLQKITLQSPDLVDERTRIDNEQKHKEAVRDSLAEILPWETRDAEMEILVDECKEVIMGLSSNEETFTGPFILSGGLKDKDDDDEEEDEDLKTARDMHAAEKSSEKLAKLQPLPALLADFDLDTHVGLIQRLFEVDKKLVEVHSKLSSGGQRELAFWKNYFFHCAYARYEAGLSIDEIWSNDPNAKKGAAAKKREEEEGFAVLDNAGASEEEVVFESEVSDEVSKPETKQSIPIIAPAVTAQVKEQSAAAASKTAVAAESLDANLDYLDNSAVDSSGGTDYDFVPEATGDDGEIDELEAEIAAALGD